jgi:hypothetical protein
MISDLEDEVSDLRREVIIHVIALKRRVRELECPGADLLTRFPF